MQASVVKPLWSHHPLLRVHQRRCNNVHFTEVLLYYLALINRARGLYGRILTEVVSTDRMQWGLCTRPRSKFSHTDRLSSVNKMFIIWRKQEQFNLFNVTGFVLTDILLANGNEPNLILPKFACLLYFFFLISLLALTEILLDETSQWFCILVCNFFTSNITGLDAGLDGKI